MAVIAAHWEGEEPAIIPKIYPTPAPQAVIRKMLVKAAREL
jgi:hypothetical protein